MLRNCLTTVGRYVSGARLDLPGRDETLRQDLHKGLRIDSLGDPPQGSLRLGAFV